VICNCGHDAGKAKFCPECGRSLAPACPQCHALVGPDAKFCSECGAELPGSGSGAQGSEAEPRTPQPEPRAEGERRQLTVLFCDLVGSTEIASRMDPEEWSDLAARYQRTAAGAATRFGGHVAKYLGDGLVVYFGYPQAHDEDAERAVRAGLAIVDALSGVGSRVQASGFGPEPRTPNPEPRLSVRVGIHTGPVVVGQGGGAEVEVFGEAPNLTARLQALAAPDTVVISGATLRLVRGVFVIEDLGRHQLKGFREPVPAYRQAREMMASLSPEKALPEAVLETISARADGIPLYVEELTRMVLESGMLAEREGRWELSGPLADLAIPATLQDSLMARLDRLSAAKDVAQRAAVLGREFQYELLIATADMDEPALRQGLERLIEAEVLFARGEPPAATYTFKHALIQDAAYQSLLKRTRQQIHARVAEAIETRFPERAAAEPEVMARHYDAAALVEPAVTYYQRAGDQAQARSAHHEAIRHFRRAIDLLVTLAESRERSKREIALQLSLGASIVPVRGYAHIDTRNAYERARGLCEEVGDNATLAAALSGLAVFHFTAGDPATSRRLGERILELGRQTPVGGHLLVAHMHMGQPDFVQGRFNSAVAHFERVISIYDPVQHRPLIFRYYGTDQGVVAYSWLALSLWALGYPDKALTHIVEVVELGQRLEHPFSRAYALLFQAVIHHWRGEAERQLETALEGIALSEQQSFPLWLGLSRAYAAAARARSAPSRFLVQEVADGLGLAATTGNQACAPILVCMLVEVNQAAGLHADALAALDMARAVAAQTSQSLWDAELQRLEGEIVLSGVDSLQPVPSSVEGSAVDREKRAEDCFQRALDIARGQAAKSFELRAATSLARLWRDQGRRAEARDLLAPIYEWFTEGFGTRDLIDAKKLLEEPK